MPDAALSEELVELYFRYTHITFHNLFHQATFTARVKDCSIAKILFFGVASLSARYSTHPTFASTPTWDRGRPYRDETKRLLNLEDTSLTSIQACMLLAANSSVEGDSRTESVYHAIASRMAMLMDLPNLPTESLLEQEINRRGSLSPSRDTDDSNIEMLTVFLSMVVSDHDRDMDNSNPVSSKVYKPI